MRGKDYKKIKGSLSIGITPAHAGKRLDGQVRHEQ